MLSNHEIHATVPAHDMARAKKFYQEKLGFHPEAETPGGAIYRCKNSWFLVYPSAGAGTAEHTVAGWTTDHIEQDVRELRERGVVFEEYDQPDFKTVGGIAVTGPNKAAWFKDSEGNILGIVQLASPV
jgi:catechol 2,3-dioxygenase-like lactoylglutathione lyase family enzyme